MILNTTRTFLFTSDIDSRQLGDFANPLRSYNTAVVELWAGTAATPTTTQRVCSPVKVSQIRVDITSVDFALNTFTRCFFYSSWRIKISRLLVISPCRVLNILLRHSGSSYGVV